MEPILRAIFMYLFLMVILRVSGSRTLSEMTTFDFVLLLIMGDASQQAITSNDYSVLNAVIIIITFVVMDMLMAIFKNKFPTLDRIIDGTPLVLLDNGRCLRKLMKRTKVEEADILEAGRKAHGLERLDQIKYAVLEKDGEITIIPKQK